MSLTVLLVIHGVDMSSYPVPEIWAEPQLSVVRVKDPQQRGQHHLSLGGISIETELVVTIMEEKELKG